MVKKIITIIAIVGSLFLLACKSNKEETKQYLVTFKDYDGTILKEEMVDENTSAQAPTNPIREGYEFIGWSEDFSNVLKNLIVIAQYKKAQHDHTFTNYIYDNNATYEKDGTETAICDFPECDVTDTKTAEGTKLRSGLSFKTLSFENNKTKIEVSNKTETFMFTEEVEVIGLSGYILARDKDGNDIITSKKAILEPGDNTFFVIEIINYEIINTYEVVIRRSPLYTVEFDTFGGSFCESEIIEEGELLKLPTTEKEGYSFKNWDYDENTPVQSNLIITAYWTPNQYNVKFDVNGGDSELQNIYVTYDKYEELPTPTREGHTFQGWYYNEIKYEDGKWTTSEDIILKAEWQVNQYCIKFYSDNRIIYRRYYDYGSEIIKPEDPTMTGYKFSGWDKEIPETMPATDLTLTAQWQINQYTITFDTTGGSSIEPIVQDYETEIMLPEDPTKIGYTFIGWDAEFPGTMPATNLTLTAQWQVNQYKMTLDLGNNKHTFMFDYLEEVVIKEPWEYNSNAPVQEMMRDFFDDLRHFYIGDLELDGKILAYSVGNEYLLDTDGDGEKDTDFTTDLDTFITKWTSAIIDSWGLFNGGDSTTGSGFLNQPEVRAKWSPFTAYMNDLMGGTFWSSAYISCGRIRDYYQGKAESFPNAINGATVDKVPKFSFLNPYMFGYTFIGWDMEIPKTMPANDVYLTAQWKIEDYSAIFKMNGNCLEKYLGIDKDVKIPSSIDVDGVNVEITSIGKSAFQGINTITSVTIPDSVTSIGDSAFNACKSLINITIPDSVISIGTYALSSCPCLTNISVSENNNNYKTIDGSLYSKDGKTLIHHASGKKDKEFVIPQGVTSIGAGAFSFSYNLTSITIPDSVTSIGEYAFNTCLSLTNITIPDSVTSIGSYAFNGCKNLKSIIIPDSVTSIGSYAFNNHYKLIIYCEASSEQPGWAEKWNGYGSDASKVYMGINKDSLFKTNDYMYILDLNNHTATITRYIGSDSKIRIPASVVIGGEEYIIDSIGDYAFYSCSSLLEVEILSTVKNMGEYVFVNSNPNLVIYCGMLQKPSGWDKNWSAGVSVIIWDPSI